MSTVRRRFQIPVSQLEKAKQTPLGASGLVRKIVEDYAAGKGTSPEPAEAEVQAFIDQGVLYRAETRAASEGVRLLDVVRSHLRARLK